MLYARMVAATQVTEYETDRSACRMMELVQIRVLRLWCGILQPRVHPRPLNPSHIISCMLVLRRMQETMSAATAAAGGRSEQQQQWHPQ
jgi:hypothetical protein